MKNNSKCLQSLCQHTAKAKAKPVTSYNGGLISNSTETQACAHSRVERTMWGWHIENWAWQRLPHIDPSTPIMPTLTMQRASHHEDGERKNVCPAEKTAWHTSCMRKGIKHSDKTPNDGLRRAHAVFSCEINHTCSFIHWIQLVSSCN